jgi:hypothetical protein
LVASIERLCTHHNVKEFDCGNETYNGLLRDYYSSCDDGDRRDAIVYVAADDALRVVAYISLTDFSFRRYTDGPDAPSRLCVLIPGFAVTEGAGARHRNLAARLVTRAFDWRDENDPSGTKYFGALCLPDISPKVDELLRGLDFERCEEAPRFLIRKFNQRRRGQRRRRE